MFLLLAMFLSGFVRVPTRFSALGDPMVLSGFVWLPGLRVSDAVTWGKVSRSSLLMRAPMRGFGERSFVGFA